jgi:hypothetical protein
VHLNKLPSRESRLLEWFCALVEGVYIYSCEGKKLIGYRCKVCDEAMPKKEFNELREQPNEKVD